MLYKNRMYRKLAGKDTPYNLQINIKNTKEALKNITYTLTHTHICTGTIYYKFGYLSPCYHTIPLKSYFYNYSISDTLGWGAMERPCRIMNDEVLSYRKNS